MIKIENLTKKFRTEETEITALKNISFQINRGEFVSITGPSGCGKSTLLDIIGLLDNITEGEYYLDGNEMSKLSERKRTLQRRGNISFLFEDINLIPEINIFDNIELPLTYLKFSAKTRKDMVTNIMKRMSISHRSDHFPHQLPPIQQQRVALARAMVTNPKVILANEPTGNLNSKNGKEILDLLTELNKEGITIVLATHSRQNSTYAQRTINLLDGEIIADITPYI